MPKQQNMNEDARVTPPTQFGGNATASDADSCLLAKFCDATLKAEPADCRDVMAEALASGVSPEDLADVYIPEVARRLGDQWCSNQLSFASVTIGVSHLQSLLRDLGSSWWGDKGTDPSAPSIMLIVAQDVHHTLGAMVLSGQLRRKGLSVCLMLGVKPQEIATRVRGTLFQAIFISSSLGETLESVRRMVDVVKASAQGNPPIVVGGTLLDDETSENVTALTGADYATKIPDEALELCGLTRLLLGEPQMLSGD
jgi:methanogenic corrinoid protein MtbC1